MDYFANSLISKYTLKIPREDDWFGPFIGDWDIRCYDQNRVQRQGQWLFRRILDGSGIEDLLICPGMTPESSAALRVYDSKARAYTTSCTVGAAMTRLRFEKEGNRIIGTNLDRPEEKHIFSEIRPDSFRWERVVLSENQAGKVCFSIYATRRRG